MAEKVETSFILISNNIFFDSSPFIVYSSYLVDSIFCVSEKTIITFIIFLIFVRYTFPILCALGTMPQRLMMEGCYAPLI